MVVCIQQLLQPGRRSPRPCRWRATLLALVLGLAFTPAASGQKAARKAETQRARTVERAYAPGGTEWLKNEARALQARTLLAQLPPLPSKNAFAIRQAKELEAKADAQLGSKRNETTESLRLRRQAVNVLKQAFGSSEPGIASFLLDLAERHYEAKRPAEAFKLLDEAITLVESAEPDCERPFRPDQWSAGLRIRKSYWLFEQGKYKESNAAYQAGAALDENPLDRSLRRANESGSWANTTTELCRAKSKLKVVPTVGVDTLVAARKLWTEGKVDEARNMLERSAQAAEAELSRASALVNDPKSFGPRMDRLFEIETTAMRWVAARPADPALAPLALQLVASRQGRLFETTGQQVRGADVMQRELFRRERAQMAHAFLQTYVPGGRDVMTSVRSNRKLLEAEAVLPTATPIANRPSGRGQPAAVASTASVKNGATDGPLAVKLAAILKSDEALVNFVLYLPESGPERYAALIQRGSSQGVMFLDLGERIAIDGEVTGLLALASKPKSPLPPLEAAAQTLHDRVWRPVAQKLGSVGHVYLAGDGSLDAFPFQILRDGGRWLLETQAFSHLTSARDLASFQVPAPPPLSRPRVYARPRPPENQKSYPAFRSLTFSDLRGAEAEARIVREHFPKAELRIGRQADEPSLLNSYSPALLHIASHAVYVDPPASTNRRHESEDDWIRAALVLSPPFLERGVWDSFATAFEVARMHLEGTRLVVLSGCGTDLGSPSTKHGARSLKRAFAMAGARAVVASAWSADDSATAALMGQFYEGLAQGLPIDEALRHAQEALRAQGLPPYFWGAWTVLGDRGALP